VEEFDQGRDEPALEINSEDEREEGDPWSVPPDKYRRYEPEAENWSSEEYEGDEDISLGTLPKGKHQ